MSVPASGVECDRGFSDWETLWGPELRVSAPVPPPPPRRCWLLSFPVYSCPDPNRARPGLMYPALASQCSRVVSLVIRGTGCVWAWLHLFWEVDMPWGRKTNVPAVLHWVTRCSPSLNLHKKDWEDYGDPGKIHIGPQARCTPALVPVVRTAGAELKGIWNFS